MRTFSSWSSLRGVDEGNYILKSVFLQGEDEVASVQKELRIYREGTRRMIEVVADVTDQSARGSEAATYQW